MNRPCVFVVLIAASLVYGAERRVPGPYSTIQQAISAAQPGDEVIISPGTYTGTNNRDLNFLGKAITVRSTNPDDPAVVAATIIDCQGTSTSKHRACNFVSGESVASVLTGLTIINGYADLAGAIDIENNSGPTISKCLIRSCTAKADNCCYYGGGAIYIQGNPLIQECRIEYCTSNGSSYAGGGAVFIRSGNPTIDLCDLQNNASTNWGGAVLAVGSCNLYRSNILSNTANTGGGVYIYAGTMVMSGCRLYGNKAENGQPGGGVYLADGSLQAINCLIHGNYANKGGAIYL